MKNYGLQIQKAVTNLIRHGDGDLETDLGVEILCDDALDIETTAARAIAETGLAVVVATPEITPTGFVDNGMSAETTCQVICAETAANRLDGTARTTALSTAIRVAIAVAKSQITPESIRETIPFDGKYAATVTFKATFTLTKE